MTTEYFVSKAEAIEQAMLADDTRETAYELVDLGVPVVPVNGRYGSGNEKAPAYSMYTATNPIDDPELAWKRAKGKGIAIAPTHDSGVLVIDADTDGDIAVLTKWWEDNFHEELPEPTVKTPGKMVDGEWVHSNGGHWWFVLPEDCFEDGINYKSTAAVRGDDKESHFDVKSEGTYCIVPPTERSEGFYQLHGHVIDLSDDMEKALKLVDLLVVYKKPASSAKKLGHAGHMSNNSSVTARIDQWQRQNSWEQILSSDGWSVVGSECRGSCAVMHHPLSTSVRSAVAHSEDCNSGYQPVLKVFSSTARCEMDIDEDKNLMKWEYWQKYRYGGSFQRAAMAAGVWTEREQRRSMRPRHNAFQSDPAAEAAGERIRERRRRRTRNFPQSGGSRAAA